MRKARYLLCCLIAFLPRVTIAQIEALEQILGLPDANRTFAIEALAHRGLPYVEENRVLFLVAQRSSRAPLLLGDFNWFGRYAGAQGLAGGTMTAVPGTKWFYQVAEFSPGARIEYVYGVDRETVWLDPNNNHANYTFGSENSVLTLQEFTPSPWLPTGDYKLKGRIEELSIDDAHGKPRQVYIYLPPGSEALSGLPSAYFHDGTLYVETVPTPQILDAMIAGGAIAPLVGVFVDPGDRSAEYRGETQFLEFFNERLVRTIEQRYPTRTEPAYRAVIGSSRGGMGALAVAWHRTPPVFGMCGMIQPAFTPATEILNRVFLGDRRPLRFSLVGGRYDARFLGDYYRALDTLLAKGYDVDYWVAPVGHSHNSWQHDIPRILAHFFAPR